MTDTRRSLVARVTLAAVFLAVVPLPAWSADGGARIEGLVIDVDGRAATDFTVHLIDDAGKGIATASTGDSGIYSFRDLPPGSYGLGIENPEGLLAPVLAPAIQVGGNELARQDVKLMQGNAPSTGATTKTGTGVGMWWAGMSKGARAGVIIGGIIVVGITAAALINDNDDEKDASPFN